MERKEFDKLEVTEQINYINSELAKGESLTNICESIVIGRTTIGRNFKKVNYSYNTDTRQYYKDDTLVMQLHQSNTKEPQETQERAKTTIEEGNTKEVQKYDNDILELVNYKDDILEMLKNYKSNTKVIEVSQLDINSLPWEMKQSIINKSIKVYEPVYKAFDKVCNSYASYKKQDLLSMALNEFCNKYKK